MPQQWQWTEQKRTAFLLIQKGKTQGEAAAAVGVTRRTLEGWTRRPGWRALWARVEAEWRAESEATMHAWRDDFERERAEKDRLLKEHMADFQQQLHESAALDYWWYKKPSERPVANEPKQRKPAKERTTLHT